MVNQVNEGEAFCYACLWPHVTGLPMRVWAPDECAQDDRLRVQITHTAEPQPNNIALVTVSDPPEIAEGSLSEPDHAAVLAFVAKNLGALLAHRSGSIDRGELAFRLRR